MTNHHLPTNPGSVVGVDGDLAMLTKFGNWVSEGVFTITNEEMEKEKFYVVFDSDDGVGW